MDKNCFLVSLSDSDRTDFGRVAFAEQSEEQKVFSAIFGMEGQVNSGGFADYFASSEGDTANFAPVALHRIGADACAGIVERALGAVSSHPLPDDEDAREELVDGLDDEAEEQLNLLDEEFFAYPDDLTSLLFAFVQSHPHAFAPVTSE